MKEVRALTPALLVAVGTAVLVLVLGMLATDERIGRFIVPTPETTAEELLRALGARRFEAARAELTEEARASVGTDDLRELANDLEQQGAGISQAHGERLAQHGDEAVVTARVRLQSARDAQLDVPLRREHGLWKVASVEPIRALAGSGR